MPSGASHLVNDAPGTHLGSAEHDLPGELYAMPPTEAQVRFWSLDQLQPGNPALNMPLMWQFTGDLEIETLRSAFVQCVARHESLRTTFAPANGRLSQIIHTQQNVALPVVDLTRLAGEAQRLEEDRLIREHAAYRFDLKHGPLLMLKLLRLAPRHHVLLVTMHHIICDGISNGILMRDMLAFYEASLKGAEANLPELAIQFADYAVWHEEWRKSPAHEESMNFWRHTLGREFQPIRLPHDADAGRFLPAHQMESTGAIETLLVPPDLTARAHAFCKREGVTLNVLLFSLFTALLSRLTEQRDLTIGSPCANRTEDTDQLIGLFMNIQVLRVRLVESSSFRDVLAQVRDWTVAASENQVLPFEDLVHDRFFQESGSSLEIPIFFLYQPSFMVNGRVESRQGSLDVVPLRSESSGAVFEIFFAVVDREEEGPRLQLEYNPQYFKATTIQRTLRLYLNLLESALSQPNVPLEALDMLSGADHERIVNTWNATTRDFGSFEPVHEAFLRRAAFAPDAIALECGGQTTTAGDLALQARSLARHLIANGVSPGDLVALYTDRSAGMVAAMLAVLIAGAAYLPLDPRQPEARTRKIITGSGARHVLADRDVPHEWKLNVVRLDQAVDETYAGFLPPVPEDALAYVIYTSGSTGEPKGVAIEHGALRNLLLSVAETPGLTSADTLVAVTTLTFDIAGLEILLPLLTGAKLVLATQDQVHTPALLLKLLRESKATVLQATPGTWRALIDEGWMRDLPLKVFCGGESLSRDLADRLLERSGEVWNMYGPTETTIWSSATRVTVGTQLPHVGPPIANTQFYILNQHGMPVPIGLVGQLWIGGAGVACGYWHNVELTERLFRPNPYAPGRMYATGDLARWDADGTLQLLGRVDFQMKVRGYRIEAGEIETVLEAHPEVSEAVVVQHVAADQPGRTAVTRMIAYVNAPSVAEPGRASTLIAELERELAGVLPDYMLPNAVVALAEFPRNSNGKVDRKALPDVFSSVGNSSLRLTEEHLQTFVVPRDTIERQLTEIWQSTLRIPRISIRASFFSLGVGSLAALRLITRMNRIYGMDLGLASLLSASSIESIAELVRNRFSANMASALVPIKAEGSKAPLYIVHGIGGNIVNFYGLCLRMGPARPVYGIQAQALLPGQPALLRLEDMAAYYLAEIAKVQPDGPYHLLGYSFGGILALEMARQLQTAGQEVALLGMLDSRTKSFEQQRLQTLSMQDKIDRRMERVSRNTRDLSAAVRVRYLAERVQTRLIRFTAMIARKLGLRTVPSFMKSAYDINYVALHGYTVHPFDGRLILFRASEQEFPGGPEDLGWSSIFTGGVEIHEITGDHERIFLEPALDVLATKLRDALARADAMAAERFAA